MSQTDSQALLQSMLERLRLQPERERNAYEHTGEALTLAPIWGSDGVGSLPNQEIETDVLTNGYAIDGPAKTFGVPSSVDRSFSPKDVERLQPVHDFQQYRGHFFFPPAKDNSHMTVNLASENATTGQDLSGKSLHYSRGTGTGSQKDKISEYKESDHGFKHNVHNWSWGSPDFTTNNEGNHSFHVGNGGFENLSKWKGMQMIPEKMTKRKQRFSENKAKRWTQKLKERWIERSSKKGKDGSKEDWMNKISAKNHLINTLHQDAEGTAPSQDSIENPTTQLEDDTIDAFMRSGDNFQINFSSASLLDEIISGQEWAKFLNSASTNQRTPEKTLSSLSITPKPTLNGPSTLSTHHTGGLNRQWSFRGCESLPVYNFHGSVNIPSTVNSIVHSQADQLEPMEEGQSHSHVQLKESGLSQSRTSYVERADILDDSPPTSKVNRKRQHHLAEMSQMSWTQNGQGQPESPENHVVDDAEENNPPFIRPQPTNVSPCAPTLRGVLRHSTFQNSDSSRESKRRRLEPNRRVHFAETVHEIPPIEVELDTLDSDDEYGTELSSGSDEEEKERMAVEEEKAVPGRRPVLPAWIRALKRKNTVRKHL
ncbi:uncharacterized protein zgc:113229 isoform X2 [Corythoichthys intestinalis]|uniref:uncharacterized protein zgc:113229 isoform X2 n=1 Tax=Corythoichthys intestinalis TaxID=161448 RepID=UPI0025A6333E|nr:uncharacterized protein zgc:113229 isoform X2 [Corythoichthys intestinalis]